MSVPGTGTPERMSSQSAAGGTRGRPSEAAPALALGVGLVSLLVLGAATGCVGVAPHEGPPEVRADDDGPAGPWDGRLVVAPAPGTPDRVVAALRGAAAYWRTNASRYAGRDVDVVVVRGDRRQRADAVVHAGTQVPDCGGADEAAGCAPVVTGAGDVPPRPVAVWVRADLDRASTRRVLTHELGHLLGIDHGSDPEVMRRAVPLSVRPRPDATAAATPWTDPDRVLSVHVDATDAADPAAVRTQVRLALSYLEDDPPGVASDWRFRLVEDPTGADVRVRVGTGVSAEGDAGAAVAANGDARGRPTNGTATGSGGGGESVRTAAPGAADCGPAAGSCGRVVGPDPDGDGAAESYRLLVVTVGDVEATAVGWHAGYWLSGTLTEGRRPPPFRGADYADRRGRWWATEDPGPNRSSTRLDSGDGR